MRVFGHAPLGPDPVLAATERLFGRPLAAVWRLDRAQRILTLDADMLMEGPQRLGIARDFIARRRVRSSPPRGSASPSATSGGPP
jgi:molybdopterin-containing oxidoreductase family iron-sulfur binding subunit